MSELTDITATFQKASDVFSPIRSKQNNGDLQRLNEVLVVCCLRVTLISTAAGSPSIVVLSNSVYKSIHCSMSFNFMLKPHADYDPAIKKLSKDDRMLMMRGLENIWVAGTANQSHIRAIEVGARNIIPANFKLTWFKELSILGPSIPASRSAQSSTASRSM